MYKGQASLKSSPFERVTDLHHVELAGHTFISDSSLVRTL